MSAAIHFQKWKLMETIKSLHISCFFPQQYNTIVRPHIHPLRRNYGEQRPANLLFNLIRYTHFPVTPISQQDTRILASPFLHLTLEPSINASISTHGIGYFYCFALSISASTLPVQEAHDNTGYVVTALPLVGLLQELLCSFFRVLNGSGQGDSFLHDKYCK